MTAATPTPTVGACASTIGGLKTDRCVYLRTSPESVDGEAIWSTEAYYTLNMIPVRAERVEPSTINGQAAGRPVRGRRWGWACCRRPTPCR